MRITNVCSEASSSHFYVCMQAPTATIYVHYLTMSYSSFQLHGSQQLASLLQKLFLPYKSLIGCCFCTAFNILSSKAQSQASVHLLQTDS